MGKTVTEFSCIHPPEGKIQQNQCNGQEQQETQDFENLFFQGGFLLDRFIGSSVREDNGRLEAFRLFEVH